MTRESYIERKAVELAKAAGWLSFKWVSPGNAGVPDRIFMRASSVVFIEFKAPGRRPTILQSRMIDRLRAEGMAVFVCDSVEAVRDALSL